MRKYGILALGVVVVAALGSVMFAYQTDYNEWTIVKTFGKPGRAYDGRTEAGLRWRLPWPIQEVVEYDLRLRLLVVELTQYNTQGSKSITVTAHCTWRIAQPLTFLDKVATEKEGEDQLRTILRSNVNTVISSQSLDTMISTGGDPKRQEALETAILAPAAEAARALGIEVTSVGIESLGVPQEGSKSIIESQKAERKTKAEQIRTQAREEKATIIVRAKEDANVVLTFAEGRAQQIRTRGFARIAEMYKQFAEFPELAVFLRKLKMMEKAFAENAVIYVDANLIDAVKMLYEKLGSQGPEKPSAPAKP